MYKKSRLHQKISIQATVMGCILWLWRHISATRSMNIHMYMYPVSTRSTSQHPAVGFENRPVRWHTHKLDLTYSCSSWFSVGIDGFQLVITHTSLTSSSYTYAPSILHTDAWIINRRAIACSSKHPYISTREDRAWKIDNDNQQWYIAI